MARGADLEEGPVQFFFEQQHFMTIIYTGKTQTYVIFFPGFGQKRRNSDFLEIYYEKYNIMRAFYNNSLLNLCVVTCRNEEEKVCSRQKNRWLKN